VQGCTGIVGQAGGTSQAGRQGPCTEASRGHAGRRVGRARKAGPDGRAGARPAGGARQSGRAGQAGRGHALAARGLGRQAGAMH
jgi:hypothetical protein